MDKENCILYQLHLLEKLIAREFVNSVRKDDFPLLSASQMQIMEYVIHNQNDGVYQKDLEDVLHLRRASVSGILKTMEKNNLIERVICESDARIKKIILNDEAIKKFEMKKEFFINMEDMMASNLSDKEKIIFRDIIKKMQNNIIDYGKKDD